MLACRNIGNAAKRVRPSTIFAVEADRAVAFETEVESSKTPQPGVIALEFAEKTV